MKGPEEGTAAAWQVATLPLGSEWGKVDFPQCSGLRGLAPSESPLEGPKATINPASSWPPWMPPYLPKCLGYHIHSHKVS